ncbi:MAG TPA: TetR/AcrR family transcriptional regulator [Euzebya sp.]|nr:TetR/AcrR family transcriptional regulator [Euzebya sp.]
MGQTADEHRVSEPSEDVGVRVSRGMATRGALVSAALELFAEKGVEHTSVDEITAAAEVAKGTFYVHFLRKQDVLLEWAAQLVDNLDTTCLADDVPQALRDLGAQLATTMATGPRPVVGRMVREMVGNRGAWIQVLGDRQPLWARIIPIIERGQAAGTIRDDMTPLRLATALTILWLDNVVGWAERERARPLRQAVDLATDLFLGGATVAPNG